MIVYISDTLDSKKNGGVSLSGLDFLQILRARYDIVNVISSDQVPSSVLQSNKCADISLYNIGETIRLAKNYKVRMSMRSVARKLQILFSNVTATKKINLSDFYSQNLPNILFVNSWSSIFQSGRIIDDSRFQKVCIVRGNPESFLWQGEDQDKEQAVFKAARYLEQFDFLIFVSDIGRARWSSKLTRAVVSFYLPNSIDEVAVSELESLNPRNVGEALGFNYSEHNLVAVGSVQSRKGQDMLIGVAKALQALGHNNFHIHVVGVVSHQWGGLDILKKVKSSDVSSMFTFYGHRDDALRFVKSADICLFPSRAEAFPRTVAEYMALGKPIVSTDASGVPEMISSGENGFLCPVDDFDRMAAQISNLINDRKLAESFGSRAKKDYESKFSKKSQVQRAQDILKKIDSLA